jgi:hypothetical protein
MHSARQASDRFDRIHELWGDAEGWGGCAAIQRASQCSELCKQHRISGVSPANNDRFHRRASGSGSGTPDSEGTLNILAKQDRADGAASPSEADGIQAAAFHLRRNKEIASSEEQELRVCSGCDFIFDNAHVSRSFAPSPP